MADTDTNVNANIDVPEIPEGYFPVNVPGIGDLYFPHGTSEADMDAAIKAHPDYWKVGEATKPQWRKTTQDVGSQFAQGAIGVGPMMPRVIAQGQAALQPYLGTGAEGANFGQRSQRNLQNITESDKAFRAAHPWGSFGLRTAGGLASMYPGARAATTVAEGLGGGLLADVGSQATMGGAAAVADKLGETYEHGDLSQLTNSDIISALKRGGLFGAGGAMIGRLLGRIGQRPEGQYESNQLAQRINQELQNENQRILERLRSGPEGEIWTHEPLETQVGRVMTRASTPTDVNPNTNDWMSILGAVGGGILGHHVGNALEGGTLGLLAGPALARQFAPNISNRLTNFTTEYMGKRIHPTTASILAALAEEKGAQGQRPGEYP